MNTNKLKTFAKEARKWLLQEVTNRLIYWGIDENGNVIEQLQSVKGGFIFREQVFDDPTIPRNPGKARSGRQATSRLLIGKSRVHGRC